MRPQILQGAVMNTELWNKPVNELTGKESVKMQLQISAVMLGIGAVAIGALHGHLIHWNARRKDNKKTEEN